MTRTLALVLILVPAQVLAQPLAPSGILDVIPKEAAAALVLRSFNDFKVKGKQLFKDLELNDLENGPAMLVAEMYKALRLGEGIDEKAPVALAILQAKKRAGFEFLEDIVLLVPIADRDKALAGFKLENKPKDNEIVVLDKIGPIEKTALVVRGKYLCFGLSEAALKRLTADSLPVSAAEKEQFGDADLLLYLGPGTGELLNTAPDLSPGNYLSRLDRYFGKRKDEEERRVGGQFIKGLSAARHSFVSLRLEQGIHLHSNIVFDAKKEKAAREMLAMLKAGTSRSSVQGLADGRALAALGWAGDGSKNGILIKLFFDVFLEGPLPGKLNDLPIFAHTDYPSVVAVTHEITQQLKGARLALYHNESEKEFGLFSALAIFDTADGAIFRKEIRTLARIADLKEADLKLPEIQKLIDIEQLTRDLDSQKFATRQAAATRLLLLGETALPQLQKSLANPLSLEQKRRVEELKKSIDHGVAQRRKEILLANAWPRSIRPSFTIAPAVEKRAGESVDVLKMSFNSKQPAFLKKVEQLFGPNWHTLRLAVVDKQVVVLLGSDVTLLERTIENLKAGKSGLADSKAFAGYQKHADKNRTAEMHGSAQGFLGLLAPEWNLPMKLFRGPAETTSFSVSFEEDRLRIDLWVPTRELRTMVHAVLPAM